MHMMKLSEAMRVGAKQHPQAFRWLYAYVAQHEGNGTCAIGAAYMAVFGQLPKLSIDTEEAYAAIMDHLGLEKEGEAEHPLYLYKQKIDQIITHLNDTCQWTREQIADWLEGIGY